MPASPVTESNALRDFHRFVALQLQNPDGPSMSPEEALTRWRTNRETIAAIQEGLDDMAAGRTRPVEELIQELESRSNVE